MSMKIGSSTFSGRDERNSLSMDRVSYTQARWSGGRYRYANPGLS